MKRIIFETFDGRFIEFTQNKITSALPYIQRRFEYYMPIDTVDVVDVEKTVKGLRIHIDQSLSSDEVMAMLEEIKDFLLSEIQKLPKHERYLCKKEDENDNGEIL